MALQGDLNSFSLPDVLRLLSGTGKSGHLEVAGDGSTGQLVLRDGDLVDAEVTCAPHAGGPSDVLYEMLRFSGGEFVFIEGEVEASGEAIGVDGAIEAAEALVAEWTEVEAVVPSMDAWLSLAPEIPGERIELTADQWRAIAAIGGGGNVRDVAGALELSDLVASRQVKELVEAEMVLLRPSHGYEPTVALDDFDEFETDLGDHGIDLGPAFTDLEDLVAEDRPVVMEDRDDALLPEPLPGEGVAYEGEIIAASVDRHTFDTEVEAHEAPLGSTDHADLLVEEPARIEGPDANDAFGEPGGADPFSLSDPDPGSASETSADLAEAFAEAVAQEEPAAEPEAEVQPDAEADGGADTDIEPVAEVSPIEGVSAPDDASGAADDAEPSGDDERGSLLRFLSSVKP